MVKKAIWAMGLAVIVSGLVCLTPRRGLAGPVVLTDVKVIHASSDPGPADPRLKDLVAELNSVFKYTSYRLVQSSSMSLAMNTTGTVPLPGERTLNVTPASVQNGRIQFRIDIFKGGTKIFGTLALLRDNSSLTIGGPEFEKGFLLFTISGRVR
ncbi:MAG: hypothetical protein V1793_24605 [Pseudomonadota bacterium]